MLFLQFKNVLCALSRKRSILNHKDTNSMNKFLVLLLIFTSFLSCDEGVEIPKEIASQNVDLTVVRFDQQFAAGTPENLPALKKEFPYFFSKRFILLSSFFMALLTLKS